MPIPSLRNLQVFEAAARHESFRAAADALFLTHGAVGRQVRALEVELGVTLFARVGRRVVLTPQGRQLQVAVTDALKLITDSTSILRREATESSRCLPITVLPSFATRWLTPRLSDFEARYPDIELEVIATIAPLDLAAKRISLGIRNGAGKWEGLSAERLAEESLFPVAAAHGIDGFAALPHSAHELLHYPLLNPYDPWDEWFRRAGVVAAAPRAGATYEDALLLLQAVEEGKGVALGRKRLVEDALRAGTLVRLPGPSIPSRRDYYVVYPEGQPLTEPARVFVTWLHEQMRED